MYRSRAVFFAVFLAYFSAAGVCEAAGNAQAYWVTVQEVLLKKTSGEWITIASPNQQINIASVAAGADAGSFIPGGKIPTGSYVNFKVRLSKTMRFSGVDALGAPGPSYTNAGGSITLTQAVAGNGAESTTNWPADPPAGQVTLGDGATTSYSAAAGAQGEVTATLNLNLANANNYIEVLATNDLATPVTITPDSVVSMVFQFDTANTVHWAAIPGNVMYFTPPQRGSAFGITVGGVSLSVTGANMKIDF